jgi:hypothetical protein
MIAITTSIINLAMLKISQVFARQVRSAFATLA